MYITSLVLSYHMNAVVHVAIFCSYFLKKHLHTLLIHISIFVDKYFPYMNTILYNMMHTFDKKNIDKVVLREI